MYEKLDMSYQCDFAALKANRILHQKKRGQQVEGGDSAPLLCSSDTSSGVLHPALETPAQERHGCVGVGPEEGHKDNPMAGAPLL